ncbi:cyclin B1 interacting protein 1, E3 ubiquitin protein ligase [Nesidiocoris tenuis]|nr:cyclin B1 interacting protein 1, E3 ubiquitin protein ligase [Nesidiocoris tenuis]
MTTPFAICNFRSCETPLLKIGWITACSHAYCDEHGENFFQNSAAFVGCPSCGRNLNLDTEVVRNDLDPPDVTIPLVPPIKLMEMAISATRFWTRQMDYRRKILHDSLLQRYESQLIESTNRLRTENRELRNHVRNVEKKLKQVQDELIATRTRYNKYKAAYHSTSHRTFSRSYNSSLDDANELNASKSY